MHTYIPKRVGGVDLAISSDVLLVWWTREAEFYGDLTLCGPYIGLVTFLCETSRISYLLINILIVLPVVLFDR